MPHRAGRNDLKPAQYAALTALDDGSAEQLTRGQYEQLTGVSRSQAAYDLAELVEAGLVERVGSGRATRYRLPRRAQPSQRHWTNERIRAALAEFCADRMAWPSAGEFKAAGHGDLYVAASRYGGIGFWASELGFSRKAKAAPRRRPRRSLRPVLRWTPVAAAFAFVLLGLGGAVLQPKTKAPAGRAVAAPRTPVVVHHAANVHPSVRPTQQQKPKPVQRAKPRPQHRSRPVVTSGTATHELASQRVTAPPVSAPPPPPPPSHAVVANGPVPIAAPSGVGGSHTPAPLPAPKH
jgi:DNA-binding transcriptional ArsR family regulator